MFGQSSKGIVAVMLVVAAAVPLLGRASSGNTFSGICDLTVQTWDSSTEPLQTHRIVLSGEGTCSGVLDGQLLPQARAIVRGSGHGFGIGVPVRDSGRGILSFPDENGIKIRFTFESAGLTAVIQGRRGGIALALFEPFTEEQPAEEGSFRLRFVVTAVELSG